MKKYSWKWIFFFAKFAFEILCILQTVQYKIHDLSDYETKTFKYVLGGKIYETRH